MKNTFKRFLSVFLICVMLMCIVPVTAFAQGDGTESNPYIATTYADLKEKMANAPADGSVYYIKLGANITSKDIQNDYTLTLTSEGQNVFLDLAGYSITRESEITVDMCVIQAKNGVLTIKDSVGGGAVIAKGKIGNAVAMISTGLLEPDNGTINIYGGSYQSYAYNNHAIYNECSKLYIFGGDFKATDNGCGYGIFAAAGRTYIYDGNFYADSNNEESKAIYLGTDQRIEIYNLTAYGNVESNSKQNNIWQYIHSTGNVYINNVQLTDRTETSDFLGNLIEIKTEMVDKIEIFVDEPVAGNEITKNAYAPMGSQYDVVQEYGENVIAWFEQTEYNGNQFAGNVFEKNKTYCVRIYVQVNIPVMPDISATVNGNKAILEFKLEAMEGHSFYWVEYTFPEIEDPVLKYVNVTIPAPKGGEIIQGGKIYGTDKFDVLADWHTSPAQSITDGYGNLNGKAAPKGTTCYATVYINVHSQNIYQFASDTMVVINGKEYEFQWLAGESFPKYIMIHNVPFEISGTGDDQGNNQSDDQGEYLLGDVNKSGVIDMMDYILLKRNYFGTFKFDEIQNKAGDVNKSGAIDMMDYILLKRVYFGTFKL